jgi:hypothetical protein
VRLGTRGHDIRHAAILERARATLVLIQHKLCPRRR